MRIRATASITTPTRAVLAAVQVSAARVFASIVSTPVTVRATATLLAGTLAASLAYAVPVAQVTEQPRLRAEIMLPTRIEDGVVASEYVAIAISTAYVDIVVTGDAIDYITVIKVLNDTVTTSDALIRVHTKPLDFDQTDADVDPDPVTTSDATALAFTRPDIADSVAATDAAALHPQPVATDSVATSDGINYLNPTKVLADTATTGDSIGPFVAVSVLADSATTSDADAKTLVRPDVVDSVTVGDSIAISPTKDVQDTTTTSDAINYLDSILDKQEVAVTSDATVVDLTRPDVADSVATSETQTYNTTSVQADDTTVSDADTKAITQVSADTATTSDSDAKAVTAVLADSVTVTDASTQLNVPTRQFDETPATSDTLRIADVGTGVDSLTINGYPFDTARFN